MLKSDRGQIRAINEVDRFGSQLRIYTHDFLTFYKDFWQLWREERKIFGFHFLELFLTIHNPERQILHLLQA